ncbi:MAG: BrnT family toxin [Aquificaceae bacterium]|uniref:BrnT family toxin n=1 Tax=Hydrogenobacter sp. Uz 6-8 TaxID=3384828 RepID=UPI0030A1F505
MNASLSEYRFVWDEKKSSTLLREWGIDFPFLVREIARGKVVDIIPNKKRGYEGQLIIILCVNQYVWEVPVRVEGKEIRLITAYPSRKRRKEYMQRLGKYPCQD